MKPTGNTSDKKIFYEMNMAPIFFPIFSIFNPKVEPKGVDLEF